MVPFTASVTLNAPVLDMVIVPELLLATAAFSRTEMLVEESVPAEGIRMSGFPLLNQVAPPSAETSNERGGVIYTLDVRLIPESKKFCVAEGAPPV